MKVQERRKRGKPRKDGLAELRMLSKRRDCQLMKCTTMLRGGVCRPTSNPHKSVNKMKRKKKTKL